MKIVKRLLIISLFFVASCSTSKFIVDKATLDPLSITVQQPLALPPVYYLSVQEIADERRILRNSRKNVSELFFGKNQPIEETNLSNIDLQFLEMVGVKKANNDIKNIINAETLGQIKKEKSFIGKIFANNNNYLSSNIAEYQNNSAKKNNFTTR